MRVPIAYVCGVYLCLPPIMTSKNKVKVSFSVLAEGVFTLLVLSLHPEKLPILLSYLREQYTAPLLALY